MKYISVKIGWPLRDDDRSRRLGRSGWRAPAGCRTAAPTAHMAEAAHERDERADDPARFGPMISFGANWRRLWMTSRCVRPRAPAPGFGANIDEGEDADDDALAHAEVEERGLEAARGLIIAWIGTTVSAEPAPKPAAVMPAARPRLSGNHFSALPMQVPYTPPAPMPAMICAA